MYLLVFDQLPAQMAQQWGADGTPNWTMPRGLAIFVMPLLLTVVHFILFFIINSASAKNSTPTSFRILFSWFIPATSIFVNLTILFGNLDESFNVRIAALVFVGLVLIIVGNYLPKTRQNHYIGIRIPWTLDSADNWNRTHRLGGRIFVLAGILFVLGAVLPLSENALIALLISTIFIALIIPIGYSFALYKRG